MNELQQYGYGQQLAPQGFLGGMFGAPLGGMIGRGLGGLLGNSQLGQQIGQAAGGIGGSILPFGADPVAAAYAQQAQQQQLQQQQQQQLQQQLQQAQLAQQSAPQGWFGNFIGQMGQPLNGGIIGPSWPGSASGNRMLPFSADPVAAAYAQQAQQAQQSQLAPQGGIGNFLGQVAQPLGGIIGGLFGQSGLGTILGGAAGELARMLPLAAGPSALSQQPLQAQQQIQQHLQQLQQIQQHLQQQQVQYAQLAQQLAQQTAQQGQQGQQGQIAPQGWIGNLLGQVGQPLGSAIGSMFGNASLGSTIGGAAGQLGRMLPFAADPLAAAYAQQAQLAQQGQFGQAPVAYAGGYQAGQTGPGLGGQAGTYGGQQTLH